MGFSLRNIGKKIEDVLGGVERQVNPFDHGATYSNPNPARPAAAPAPRQAAPVTYPGQSLPGRRVAVSPRYFGAPQQSTPQAVVNAPTTPVDTRSSFSKLFDQVNPLDNGRTFKDATPNNNRSLVGQIANNGITDSMVKPLVQFPVDASNAIYNNVVAPGLHLNKQNLSGPNGTALNPFENRLAKWSGANGTTHQLVGSGLQTALTIGSAGISNALEAPAAGAVGMVAPKLASQYVADAAAHAAAGLPSTLVKSAVPTAIKYTGGALTGSVVNSGFNAASGIGENAKPMEILKSTPKAAATGLLFDVGGHVIGDLGKPAVKAASKTVVKKAQHASDVMNGRVPMDPVKEGGFIMAGKASPEARAKGVKFQDPVTGKVLWEGSDQNMQLKPGALKGLVQNGKAMKAPVPKGAARPQRMTLGDVIKHDDLFEAYPHLKDVPVVAKDMDGYAAFNKDTGVLSLNPKYFNDKLETKKSIIHEITHKTQQDEGLPSGGSSAVGKLGRDELAAQLKEKANSPSVRSFLDRSKEYIDSARKAGATTEEINAALRAHEATASPEAVQFMKDLRRHKELANMSDGELYARLHGEAFARIPERRINMSKSQRENQPFLDDLDVPESQLITEHDAGHQRLQSMLDNFEFGDDMKQAKPKVVKKQELTKEEIKAGRALGMSTKEILAAKKGDGLSTALQDHTQGMSADELANLKPGEQMAIDRLIKDGPQRKKSPIAKNIGRNPYKSTVPNVAPGDYARARINPGTVSHPIKFAGSQLDRALRKLGKSNPEDLKNFWIHAESAPKNPSPQLKEALYWWREVANRVHGETVRAGVNTNYLQNFALHPWDLAKVSEDQIAAGGPGMLGSHAMGRKHLTITEGLSKGLQLGTDPRAEAAKYVNGTTKALEHQSAGYRRPR